MTPEQAALVERRGPACKRRLLADKGYFDFAVSRAYYCMFYLAEATLLEEQLGLLQARGRHCGFRTVFAKTGRVSTQFHRYLMEETVLAEMRATTIRGRASVPMRRQSRSLAENP